MLYAIMGILIVANVFLWIFLFKIEEQDEHDWQCRTCMYNTITSNQHPNMCDDCNKGSHYCNWLEGGYKE